MMRPLQCCRCGCARFQKLHESCVELFGWTDGEAEYAYEQRVSGSNVMSSFICAQCGNAAPIAPARWNKLRSVDPTPEEASGTAGVDNSRREEDSEHAAAALPIAPQWRRIP